MTGTGYFRLALVGAALLGLSAGVAQGQGGMTPGQMMGSEKAGKQAAPVEEKDGNTAAAATGRHMAFEDWHAYAHQHGLAHERGRDYGMMMGNGMTGRGMISHGMIGHGMMGRGMMMGSDQHMRSGREMGSAYRRSFRRSSGFGRRVIARKNLTVADVRKFMERRLAWRGRDLLKIGEVKEKDDHTFSVEIVTKKEGALVRHLEVDRDYGFIRRTP